MRIKKKTTTHDCWTAMEQHNWTNQHSN